MGRLNAGARTTPEERAHWGMLALAWSVYAGFGMVSASLPALITPIRRDVPLTYAELGVVLGAWQLIYIPVSYPAGLFIDRIGTRRALTLGASLIALSGVMRAFAGDFVGLFASVAIFGLGGPIISIGLPKVIASWFIGRPRAVASGIYTTGSTAGNVATLALTSGVVLPALGSWRAVCVLYGLVVAGIAVAWWLLGRDPEDARSGGSGQSSARADGTWGTVLRTPAVWLVVVVGFTGFMIGHGFRSWLPQILEAKGLSPAEAGYLAALPGLASIAGAITITRVAARVGRKPVIAGLLVVVAACLAVADALNGPPLVALLLVQGFCAGAILPLLVSMLMDLREVGASAMGAAAGLYFAVGEVGGFAGPSMMGLLKDWTGGFMAGLLLLTAITLAMLIPTSLLRDPRRA